MPLYEYKCPECGSTFEVIEKVSDKLKKKCPKCGAVAKRLLSAPAIQFKGSGWYVTDYAQESRQKSPSKGKPSPEKKKDKDKKETKTNPPPPSK
jgi:putative FmdB family regulatory protein